jgi:hypothetical protein
VGKILEFGEIMLDLIAVVIVVGGYAIYKAVGMAKIKAEVLKIEAETKTTASADLAAVILRLKAIL